MLHPADCRPHRTRRFDAATVEQQLFCQRGLACVRVGNNGKRPPAGSFAGNDRIGKSHGEEFAMSTGTGTGDIR
jgi:hypothetical protein